MFHTCEVLPRPSALCRILPAGWSCESEAEASGTSKREGLPDPWPWLHLSMWVTIGEGHQGEAAASCTWHPSRRNLLQGHLVQSSHFEYEETEAQQGEVTCQPMYVREFKLSNIKEDWLVMKTLGQNLHKRFFIFPPHFVTFSLNSASSLFSDTKWRS